MIKANGLTRINRLLNSLIIIIFTGMALSLVWPTIDFSAVGLSLSIERLSKPLFYVMSLFFIKYLIYRPFHIETHQVLIRVATEQKKKHGAFHKLNFGNTCFYFDLLFIP